MKANDLMAKAVQAATSARVLLDITLRIARHYDSESQSWLNLKIAEAEAA